MRPLVGRCLLAGLPVDHLMLLSSGYEEKYKYKNPKSAAPGRRRDRILELRSYKENCREPGSVGAPEVHDACIRPVGSLCCLVITWQNLAALPSRQRQL